MDLPPSGCVPFSKNMNLRSLIEFSGGGVRVCHLQLFQLTVTVSVFGWTSPRNMMT